MSIDNSLSLAEIYAKSENPGCLGCSILNVGKPFHCWKDYKEAVITSVDVLFITDSPRYNGWEKDVFSPGEHDLFNELVLPLLTGLTYAISPSVKCPNVKETEMNAKNMGVCRKYIEETVDKYKPKLIIPLGNLAFKMLMKKSGMGKNHASEFRYKEIPVVPTYNPSIIFIEPKYKETIFNDISIALNKFIHKTNVPVDLDYEVIQSLSAFKHYEWLTTTDKTISFDIESTGLNMLTDKILTIAISWYDNSEIKSICIPIFHKESQIPPDELDEVLNLLRSILQNKNNIKCGHNVKFDLRFLYDLDIKCVNVWDTKSMTLLVNENTGTGLAEQVKRYFPADMDVL